MNLFTRGAVLALVLCSASPLAAQGKLKWEANLRGALAEAQSRNAPVMITIALEGERGSDDLVAEHYRDAKIVTLSKRTANLIYFVERGSEPVGEARDVRTRYLDLEGGDAVELPLHVFVRPGAASDEEPDSGNEDGRLISVVPGRVTLGQLEWAMADAIRRVDDTFEWPLTDRMRAPERIQYQDPDVGSVPPPELGDLDDTLKELKKSRRGLWRGDALQKIATVLYADDSAAIKYVEGALRTLGGFGGRGGRRGGRGGDDSEDDEGEQSRRAAGGGTRGSILDAIGLVSTRSWWTVPGEWVDDRSTGVRTAAIRAIGRLWEPKGGARLRKHWRSESDLAVKQELIRAIAAASPANRPTAQLVTKTAKSSKDEFLRAHATMAAIPLEARKDVEAILRTALADSSPTVRATAAYAIAARREQSLLALLDETAATERNTDAKKWLTTAVSILREDSDTREFDRFVDALVGDAPQTLADLGRMFRPRNNRGRGDEDGSGEGDGGDNGGGGRGGGRGGRRRGR